MPCVKTKIAAVVLALTALAGCSNDEAALAPPPVVKEKAAPAKLSPTKMMAAMGSLSSLSVRVDFNGGATTLTSSLSSDGRCAGNVEGDEVGGGAMSFVGQGNRIYVRGDKKFWLDQDAVNGPRLSELLGSRWLVISRAQFGNYFTYCSFNELLSPVLQKRFKNDFTVLGSEVVSGQPATRVTDKSEKTMAWIGANNRLLRLERSGVSVRYSQFNRVDVDNVPDPSQTLSLQDIEFD